jgi:hypothetical protein
MPLIARTPVDHSIREFRAAAGMRYHEARRLAVLGDRLAAIYLWGYAAEMLLKAAYFRLIGRAPTQPITVSDLLTAKQYAKNQLGLVWHGNLHDLSRWRDLLVEERRLRNLAYPFAFARTLNARVKQISLNWREHLRYRTNRPYQGEVARVFQAVRWLIGEYNLL